jgi:hypothetical protein
VSPPEPFKLKGLVLEGLVVHELAKGTPRLDPAVQADLSPGEAPPDSSVLDFLDLQLRNGMTEGGYPAAFVDYPPSAGAALLIGLLDGPLTSASLSPSDIETIVTSSQQLANELQAAQEHNSPAGMFAFCRGRLTGGPVAAVMKLESQQGLQLDRSQDVLALKVNRDLFVGNKAKLFKAAIFWRDGATVRVMVCDEQTAGSASHPAADFFVRELLGCTVGDNSKVRTAKFFDAIAKASSVLENAEDRAHVLDALRVELGSNRRQLDPAQFIAENFPDEQQRAAEAVLKRQGLDPASRFAKDVSTIQRQFKRTTFRFEDGPSVIAADATVKTILGGEHFDESFQGVQIRYAGDRATMLIRGKVDEIRPRS